MNITTQFEATKLADLELAPYAAMDASATVCDTVASMNALGATCAVVLSDDGPVGILTDRDVVQRAVEHPGVWDHPVTEMMTKEARGLPHSATVLQALQLMNERRLRHVVIVDGDGEVAGVASDTSLVKVIDALLSDRAIQEEHEPGAQHGLLFIDFTGLAAKKPVTVYPSDPLETAIHHLRVRAIGSVLVCDDRGSLVGVLTERDLLRKVACSVRDLRGEIVGTYMTEDPISLSPRDMIAEGFHAMAEHGFTHLPLVAETGRPVGIASFRDLADYLETNVAAVG